MKLGKHSRISKPRRLLIEMEKPVGTALLTASLVVTMSGVPLSAFAQGSSAETDAETAAQLEASSDDAADAAGEDEASSSEPGSNTGATADEGAGQPSKDGQSGEDAEQPAENENTGEQGSGSEENPGQGSEQGEDSQKGQGVSDHQNPGAEENGSENKGSEGEKTEGESSQEEQVPSEVKPAVEESKEEVKPVSEVEFAAAVESAMRQSSSLSATQTELAVAKRLLEAGWTPEMAAAAVGNMYAESGSNAASFANMSGMFNYAYEVAGGIFQWTDAGSSHASLSCAGFTGLTNYAASQGAAWSDPELQADYFLKTWKQSWMARSTYYDAVAPGYAGVDDSLGAFDESTPRDAEAEGSGVKEVEPITEESRQHVANLTFAFMAGYEGPSAAVCHLEWRIGHALRMYPAIKAMDEALDMNLGNDNAALVVAAAESMVGGTYAQSGDPSTSSFSNAALTQWAYSLAGVDIANWSNGQLREANQVVTVTEAVPGDILWSSDGVAIYTGGGKAVEASSEDGITYVSASKFDSALHFSQLDGSYDAVASGTVEEAEEHVNLTEPYVSVASISSVETPADAVAAIMQFGSGVRSWS